MAYTIKSPLEDHDGASTFGTVVLGFRNGEAQVDDMSDGLKAYLEAAGYEVSGDAPEDEQDSPEDEQGDPDLSKLSKAQLQAKADELGVEYRKDDKVAELIDKINAATAAEEVI